MKRNEHPEPRSSNFNYDWDNSSGLSALEIALCDNSDGWKHGVNGWEVGWVATARAGGLDTWRSTNYHTHFTFGHTEIGQCSFSRLDSEALIGPAITDKHNYQSLPKYCRMIPRTRRRLCSPSYKRTVNTIAMTISLLWEIFMVAELWMNGRSARLRASTKSTSGLIVFDLVIS